MSVQELEDWMLPDLVDDAECDVCDDAAMPFDNNADYGFCPPHGIENITGWASEDFEIDPESQRNYEYAATLTQRMCSSEVCLAYGCHESAVPRIRNTGNSYWSSQSRSLSFCTEHAVERVLASRRLYPFTVLDWVEDVTVG